MIEQNSGHKLNDFGFIDYKKPLDKQHDMRTSTYIGHKLMDDKTMGNKLLATYKETRSYKEDSVLEKHRTTDYKSNFIWKFGNPNDIRNIALDRNIHHMKPFYDCNVKFLKRPMKPACSITHSDYLWQPKTLTFSPLSLHIPTPVSKTKVLIDRNKPGYSKYLDPAATTNNLDYCYRSPKDLLNGIAAKDNITFWNWKDNEYRDKKVFRAKDAQLCDKLPSKDCPKRRCEFPSKVKSVPNSGLTTEVRENYVKLNLRTLDYDDSHIRNDITFVTNEQPIRSTEYNILGSGECTQKYV